MSSDTRKTSRNSLVAVNESQAASADTGQDDDVTLPTLKGVHRGHLHTRHLLLGLTGDAPAAPDGFHDAPRLCFVQGDYPNGGCWQATRY